MTLVFRDDEKAPAPQAAPEQAEAPRETPVRVVTIEETEEQKRVAAERIARLRNMSFNVKNMEAPQELESVPAYIRRNVNLDEPEGSGTAPYSGYRVNKGEDGQPARISTLNTFLDGKKPD